MHHRPDFREAQLVIRNAQRRADEFGRIPAPPGVGMKIVANLKAPAWFKGILIQSTPTR